MRTYQEIKKKLEMVLIMQKMNDAECKKIRYEVARLTYEMMDINSIVKLCRTGK